MSGPSRLRWAILIALTLTCAGSLFGLVSVDSAAGSGDSARKPASDDGSRFGADAQGGDGDAADSGQCLANPDAIQDIRLQREKLARMKKDLDAREAELKAREQAVADEMKRLDQVRDEITKTEDLKRQENQDKVSKLIDTIESMSPKPAAQLLSSIDEALAVTAMQGVSTAKLAKIMNVMDPQRSTRLTEVLAGVVRARALSQAGAQPRAANDLGRGIGATNNGNTNVKGGESNGQRNNNPGGTGTTPGSPGSNIGQSQDSGQRQPAGGGSGAAASGP